MDTGEYDRHVRRLRKHYHRRRDSIVDGIGRVMPDAVAEGYAAGLHLLLRLPKNAAETKASSSTFLGRRRSK